MNLARLGNKYLADNEPWKLVKEDPIRVETIMNIALQITANLSVVFQPFLPLTANKIGGFLNFQETSWDYAGNSNLLSTGHQTTRNFIFKNRRFNG